jgi:hypothetical protein
MSLGNDVGRFSASQFNPLVGTTSTSLSNVLFSTRSTGLQRVSSKIEMTKRRMFRTTWKSSLPALVGGPTYVVDSALIGPFIGPGNQLLPKWILADIGQLVFILDAIAKPMMEGLALP